MKWIRAEKINKRLDSLQVLKDVDLYLEKGELVGLVGPNGAGKTTLLRILSGFLKPDSGTFQIDEWIPSLHPLPCGGKEKGEGGFTSKRDGQCDRKKQLSKILAYLPQGQEIHWPLSVEKVVSLGRIPHLMPWEQLGAEDQEAVQEAMAITDILALAERSMDRLAGGEKRLVLLARALATKPSIILADEPVQGLDPSHGLQVMELLRKFVSGGCGAVVVLHDLALAARFCDRVILLNQGRVMASGRPEEVLTAEHLAKSYHIEAKYGNNDGFFVVPWRRL